MLSLSFSLARPLLFGLEPERAHELTLRALESGVYPRCGAGSDVRLSVSAMGLVFPNPIGIAAGYDKDARVPDAVLGMGCGFAEVGTITPVPQAGNPQPRVFRLVEQGALINRLGFNNGGHAAALRRLKARAARSGSVGRIVGVNVGANKDTEDKAADYVRGVDTFYDVASYIMVNISSPNTPGLRDLQAPAALDALLGRVMAARAARMAAGAPKKPIAVKIAPDLAEADLAPIVERMLAHKVDAIAVSNTTLSRPGATGSGRSGEAGGLSGRPLFHRSTVVLARVFELTGGSVPLIGIGGINSGATAVAKMRAGATLLQLYTGLIYQGPGLIGEMRRALAAAVAGESGAATLAALVGRDAKAWAARPLDE